jgi:hypothetical protein
LEHSRNLPQRPLSASIPHDFGFLPSLYTSYLCAKRVRQSRFS